MNFFSRSNNHSNTASVHGSYHFRELEGTPRTTHSSSHTQSVMYTRDWRSALRTPPPYRIGNRTVRFNYHFALLVVCVFALLCIFFYVRTGSTSTSDSAWLKKYASSTSKSSSSETAGRDDSKNGDTSIYNAKYPLTPPLVGNNGAFTYRIAMIADLDTNSKVVKKDGSTVWRSYLKKGHLTYAGVKGGIKVKWDIGEPIPLESSFSLKGRGMELSELVTFNGKLLSFDDRTGLIYELVNDRPIPWVILMDGNGHSTKGFKAEWAAVKNRTLYIGSMGKEWTSSMGEFLNEDPMFVKVVSPSGEVRSLNWSSHFKVLRKESQQITFPGYMIHESALWSEVHKKWFFLPRRCSKERYNETRDEHMGCNVLISADENFEKIASVPLDTANKSPTHGFSSFKFIPLTGDRTIVALKTEELDGKTSTFITVFDITGNTLLPEQRIETDFKYEGIEFI